MEYTITVLPHNKTVRASENTTLLDTLAQNGFFLAAACGGKGTCGKCKVRLLAGTVRGSAPDTNGELLSCAAYPQSDLTLLLPRSNGEGLSSFFTASPKSRGEGLGAILDVGTTTLAMCLIDMQSGRILQKTSCLNPQGVCGADVLSRIQAFGEGKGALLQSLVLQKAEEMLRELLANTSQSRVRELTVAANTTMLHLFLGVDPSTIGVYPFTPVFTDTQIREGDSLGLRADRVRLLPSVSAYIGSDVTAGVLACGMHRKEETALFVDIGTNGEIVLSRGGTLCAASTAAGPALEGACIECGMGGVAGAIDSVTLQNGTLSFTTVHASPARGICGSGLIDLFACLLREGLIDESGAWDPDAKTPLARYLAEDCFYLTEDIYLSQKDIRQFQLAKAAIAAGIATLLAENGIGEEDVDALYIAGGLGFYMNAQNAAAVGLLPAALTKKAKAVGNTALAGAHLCLLDDAEQEQIERIAKETQILELSFSATFQEQYMEGMMFSEREETHDD